MTYVLIIVTACAGLIQVPGYRTIEECADQRQDVLHRQNRDILVLECKEASPDGRFCSYSYSCSKK
jgi:hypothetical protein